MADTVDSMAVELVANLQPFFDQLKTGLEAAKARINAFKAEGGGKVELTAETKGLVDGLNTAVNKTQSWRKETEDAMQKAGSSAKDMGKQVEDAGKQGASSLAGMVKGFVAMYLTVETARRAVEYFKSGIIDAAQQQREVAGLGAQFADMGLNVEEAQAQVEAFTTSMKGAGFEDDQTRAAILRMLPVTGNLTQAMSAVRVAIGWNIKYNKDFNETLDLMTGLIAGSARALMPKTLAEYGIQVDKTKSQVEQFQQVLDVMARKVEGVATGTGDAKAKIGELSVAVGDVRKGVGAEFLPMIEKWGGALHALGLNFEAVAKSSAAAGVGLTRGIVDVVTAGTFELVLWRLGSMADKLNALSKAQGILSSLKSDEAPQTNARQAAIEEQVNAANALVAKLKSQAEVDAANKSAAAWKKAMAESQKAAEDFWKSFTAGVEKGKQSWAEAAARIRMESLTPQDQSETKVRLQAAEDEKLARLQITDAKELASMLEMIERNKQNAIAEIRQEYADKEAAANKRAADKAQADAEKAIQRRQTAYQKDLTRLTQPFQHFMNEIETKMNAPLTALASRVVGAMTTVSNAIRSMLNGMKVSWSQVLRSMIVDFVMILVDKFLAALAGMIVAWVMGEATKSAASTAGATEQATAAETAATANATVASTAMSAAIAQIFEAHSAIPFAGVPIAAGYASMALGIWSALSGVAKAVSIGLSAFATGGLVDRPTIGLVGEAGPEIIAPVSDFKTVVQSLLVDTVQTVRDVAAMAGGGQGGTYGGMNVRSQQNIYGFALMDTGRRQFARQTVRMLNRVAREEKRLTFGGA